jgi:ketosteroid isomerase-like protein
MISHSLFRSLAVCGALYLQSVALAPFPFEAYRGVFKTNKLNVDGMAIDRADASGDLAYVVFHFHEVLKTIKTNEVVVDVSHSAVATLKKDAAGKWKMAFLGYKD